MFFLPTNPYILEHVSRNIAESDVKHQKINQLFTCTCTIMDIGLQ